MKGNLCSELGFASPVFPSSDISFSLELWCKLYSKPVNWSGSWDRCTSLTCSADSVKLCCNSCVTCSCSPAPMELLNPKLRRPAHSDEIDLNATFDVETPKHQPHKTQSAPAKKIKLDKKPWVMFLHSAGLLLLVCLALPLPHVLQVVLYLLYVPCSLLERERTPLECVCCCRTMSQPRSN